MLTCPLLRVPRLEGLRGTLYTCNWTGPCGGTTNVGNIEVSTDDRLMMMALMHV